MWTPRSHGHAEEGGHHSLVAVAIDKDRGSQHALKWTLDNLVHKGDTILLVHVKVKNSAHSTNHHSNSHSSNHSSGHSGNHSGGHSSPHEDSYEKELFLPFRCFCTRKDVRSENIILEDTDIVKAVTEFVSHAAVEKLVVGTPTHHSFVRRFRAEIPTSISKGAPDFCTVYVINSKEKPTSIRRAIRKAPTISSLLPHIQNQQSIKPDLGNSHFSHSSRDEAKLLNSHHLHHDKESIKSPFSRGARGPNTKSYGELALPETDISFVSSGRPSTDRMFPSLYDHLDSNRPPRLSNDSESLDRSFESSYTSHTTHKLVDMSMMGQGFSSHSHDSGSSWSSRTMDEVEAEMKRLRQELEQTMGLYSSACKEALTAKQKARELHRWKMEEEQRLEEARLHEEEAIALAEREKVKCQAAIEKAEAAQKIAELEAQRRRYAEMKALREAEEKNRALNALAHKDLRYRKYSIEEIEIATDYFAEERKIGEGGYGPVYKGYLDHTPVAIKVLRPDAAQGRSQFQQEVEVLSCIRHPNMVLLLGACPEYGCLVYEYLANGSLDDRLFRKGNTPVLPWQLRFRIAAEIATGLLFLHQTKPEPLVHRDLKPGNILLDRNYVSKISDVGLARLVPPNVANDVTQYRMTSTAGTFCYIDPEYQQTGMLGIKSDIYSFGIMLLQLITGKPPMGLAFHVDRAIERGEFEQMLDPAVIDWPVEKALSFAKMAIKCAELRRKDRPDLATVILPELERLSELAEENRQDGMVGWASPSTNHSQVSMHHDIMSDPALVQSSGYDSSKSRASASSFPGRRISIS